MGRTTGRQTMRAADNGENATLAAKGCNRAQFCLLRRPAEIVPFGRSPNLEF